MRKKMLPVLVGAIGLVLTTPSLYAGDKDKSPPPSAAKPPVATSPLVAKVGDWKLSLEEVNKLLASQIYRAELQVYQLQMQVIQDRVAEQLLNMEAKDEKISVDDLLKKEVDAKTPKVSDEDVKKVIEANKGRFPNNGAGMENEIRGRMEEINKTKVRDEYLRGLGKKFGAEIGLPPPVAPRFKIPNLPNEPSKGKANAPVVIYEFADFQCPYCAKEAPILDQLVKDFPDDVRLVYRHFPLPNHNLAQKASEAAQCAEEQGKFWDFYNQMYGDQAHLEVADLKGFAEKFKLDTKKFNECLDSGKTAKRVLEDRDIGDKLGISGTPTVFINGFELVGALPVEQVKPLIENEIKKKRQGEAKDKK